MADGFEQQKRMEESISKIRTALLKSIELKERVDYQKGN